MIDIFSARKSETNFRSTSSGRIKGTAKAAACLATTLTAAHLPLSSVSYADIIGATHTALVSEFASFNTPGVVDGRVEAIAVEGDIVFVGGTFTQIHDPLSDEIVDQPYLFAYSKSTGDIIRSFDPVLNNDVLALEKTGEGTGVFVGGVFSNINGQIRRGLIKLDNNGDRVSGFGARPNALVKSMVRLDDTLYIGGGFESISGTPVENLAAINTVTGAVDPNLNIDFDGAFSSVGFVGTQSVDEVDITPDGGLLVVVGNFSLIDGVNRERVAVLELEGEARVSDWNTNVYDGPCRVARFPQYIFGMDVSPDGSYFVTGSSGNFIRNDPACDATNRFELDDLSNGDVQPTWTNFTGGDSVYEVLTTDHAVYIGGHFEFLDNDFGYGNTGGPASTQRAGLAALDPLNGLTIRDWQSDRNPRGLGVFAILSEDEGIYFGDDTDFLNGTEHKKLKFMPITSNVIARPDVPKLPTTLLSVNSNILSGGAFDGNQIGSAVALSSTDFYQLSGAMFVGGRLFYSSSDGGMFVSSFSDGVFAPGSSVDLFGVDENEWELSRIGGMFFDYEWSRVYYTLQGDSNLYYRAFSPRTPHFGNDPLAAEQQGDVPWSDVTGMDVIGDHLYFTRTDGVLYRSDIAGAAVISGTTVAFSGVGIDGRSWDSNALAFLGDGEPIGEQIPAQFQFDSSGSQSAGRVRNFEFEVAAGEPVDLRLEWLDPSAQLNLFVRDASDNLVASDNSTIGSPKFVTIPAGAGGTHVAKVIVREGSSAYTLQINPDEPRPEPLADFEFSSSGSNDSGRFQRFDFDVVAGELVEAQVLWDNTDADLRVFLRDENGVQIDRDSDGSGTPAMVGAIAATSGTYSLAVRVDSDVALDFEVLIDTIEEGAPTVVITDQPVDITNIALNGIASQTSTRFGGLASRAIDGSTNGRYRNDSVTRTANTGQPSWQVELAELSTIQSIAIYNRIDNCCAQRLTDFTVSVLDTNGAVVYSQSFSNAPNPSITIDLDSVVGATVRVQLNGTDALSLAEVQVMGYGNSALMQ